MATVFNLRTPIIAILTFLGFMALSLSTTARAQSPNYVGDDCQNSTEQALTTAYQTNLNKVLSWLSSDAATSKGYNHTTIGTNTSDTVYGFYDCRADVTESFCQFCVSTAASEIPQRCPNRSSAVICTTSAFSGTRTVISLGNSQQPRHGKFWGPRTSLAHKNFRKLRNLCRV